MTHHSGSDLKELMARLCEVAAQETLPRFRHTATLSNVTNKLEAGFDPVTEADKQAEKAIRTVLKEVVPNHGIVGEEWGSENDGAEYVWVLDPIDGTRAFISGIPVWGTLIGLYRNGKPYAGTMDQPHMGERFIAVPDENGTLKAQLLNRHDDPVPLNTAETSDLAAAKLMTTDPFLFAADEQPRFDALSEKVQLARYGCDCYAYCMLAAGQVDLVVESGLNAYDIAALIPIIEGAGGIVTTWQGEDAAQGGQILAAANTKLHSQAMAVLAK